MSTVPTMLVCCNNMSVHWSSFQFRFEETFLYWTSVEMIQSCQFWFKNSVGMFLLMKILQVIYFKTQCNMNWRSTNWNFLKSSDLYVKIVWKKGCTIEPGYHYFREELGVGSLPLGVATFGIYQRLQFFHVTFRGVATFGGSLLLEVYNIYILVL